jgi:hypothetical protein
VTTLSFPPPDYAPNCPKCLDYWRDCMFRLHIARSEGRRDVSDGDARRFVLAWHLDGRH